MEEKKMLQKIWDSLTDEQKEKARACKTDEELIALAAKEGVELPEEALDAVSGGACSVITSDTFPRRFF